MKCPEEINKILFIKRETYDVVFLDFICKWELFI